MAKIGVFDSGYGGLTILDSIRRVLPEYDYLYLGDNARAPYGTHSFEVIYRYTLQAVNFLFEQGCTLVILACNTASANSESYVLELEKIANELRVPQLACPMWVPLIEAGEHNSPGADYFVDKYLRAILDQDPLIDTLVLGCTHYPLLLKKIESFLQNYAITKSQTHRITPISQGSLVASSLAEYLVRHPEYASQLSLNGSCRYLTTENADRFSQSASLFLSAPVFAEHIDL